MKTVLLITSLFFGLAITLSAQSLPDSLLAKPVVEKPGIVLKKRYTVRLTLMDGTSQKGTLYAIADSVLWLASRRDALFGSSTLGPGEKPWPVALDDIRKGVVMDKKPVYYGAIIGVGVSRLASFLMGAPILVGTLVGIACVPRYRLRSGKAADWQELSKKVAGDALEIEKVQQKNEQPMIYPLQKKEPEMVKPLPPTAIRNAPR